MWAFVVLGLLFRFSSCLGACTEKCNQPILLYDTLKCTPVFESTTNCCPSKYDCSNIEEKAKSNVDTCHFEGKIYADRQFINDSDINRNCLAACYCRAGNQKYYRKTAGFVCDELECWHRFGVPLEPGCYLKFEVDKCCSVETFCATPQGTCTIRNKTLRYGELFPDPTQDCSRCVCQKGFKGEFKEPFCQKQKCVAEIHNQKEVYGFCAPTYITLDQCCPHTWTCPRATDHIIKANESSKHKCKFGKSLLDIGDEFSRIVDKTEKVTCKCRIPPYLTCIASIIHNHDSSSFKEDKLISTASSGISVLSLIISSYLSHILVLLTTIFFVENDM